MIVSLRADGVVWHGWQSFQIKKTLEKAQHSFTMTTTDQYQEGLQRWNVRGGSLVDVYFGDDLAFSGYVQKYDPTIVGDSRTITISGESKAVDLVQTSHKGEYFWKDTSAESIIQEITAPYGIDVTILGDLEPIKSTGFRAAVGESPFSIIKKLAERNGLLVFTDSDGGFTLSDTEELGGYSELTTGDFIQAGSNHDVSKSYSEVIVKGQRNSFEGDFASNQRGEYTVGNSAQSRYRPLILMVTGQDQEQDKLDKYVNKRLSGDSLKANVTVKSAYDKNGAMWRVGQRIWLREDLIDVNNELIVSDLTFSMDESKGFETTMNLKLPETYTASGPARRTVRKSGGLFQDTLRGLF